MEIKHRSSQTWFKAMVAWYWSVQCGFWGRSWAGPLSVLGVTQWLHSGSCRTDDEHYFCFSLFFFCFYESENSSSDFFPFMKIDTNVGLSSNQGDVKWTLKKQEIHVSLSLFVDKCQFLTFSTQVFFLLSVKTITGTAILLKAVFN